MSSDAPLEANIVLPETSTNTPPSVAHFPKKRFHAYSDEILTRLLIDLFLSKKEQQPHAEDKASSNE